MSFDPRPTGTPPRVVEVTGKLLGVGVVGVPCMVHLSRFDIRYLPLFDDEAQLRDLLGLAGCVVASIKRISDPAAFAASVDELRVACGDVRVITNLTCKDRETLHMVWMELRL